MTVPGHQQRGAALVLWTALLALGAGAAAALTPAEHKLLHQVLEVCDGVKEWTTFSTRSKFSRDTYLGDVLKRVEWEDVSVQFQKHSGGNYAAYVRANRSDATLDESIDPPDYTINDLRLEIIQGGNFLLKIVEASDAYLGYALRSFGTGWFSPKDSGYNGRLPAGNEFSDHVHLGLGKPSHLKPGNLEAIKEVAGKTIENTLAKCVELLYKEEKEKYVGHSITFCYAESEGLMEVTEKVDTKKSNMRDASKGEIHSVATRSYRGINGVVRFPIQPAPFPTASIHEVSKRENRLSKLATWLHSYVVILGVGVVLLLVLLVVVLHLVINRKPTRRAPENEPLLVDGQGEGPAGALPPPVLV